MHTVRYSAYVKKTSTNSLYGEKHAGRACDLDICDVPKQNLTAGQSQVGQGNRFRSRSQWPRAATVIVVDQPQRLRSSNRPVGIVRSATASHTTPRVRYITELILYRTWEIVQHMIDDLPSSSPCPR